MSSKTEINLDPIFDECKTYSIENLVICIPNQNLYVPVLNSLEDKDFFRITRLQMLEKLAIHVIKKIGQYTTMLVFKL